MDIKKKIEELVEKIQSDKELQAKFQKDPVAALESLLGVDLPEDRIQQLVDGIKLKLTADNIGSALGTLDSLFGKKN